MMKEIGGFLSFELNGQSDLHQNGLGFNTARSALFALLEYAASTSTRKLRIGLPAFLCPDVLQILGERSLNLSIETYNLSDDLQPNYNPSDLDVFYYYNVFGLLRPPKAKLAKWMIVDNAHAFFEPPNAAFHTIYSARKFLGVPDGAFLYSDAPIIESPQAESWHQSVHLLRRVDTDAASAYSAFREAEDALATSPVRGISRLSKAIIRAADAGFITNVRRANFEILHRGLKKRNELSRHVENALGRDTFVPFMYPFLNPNGAKVRRRLLDRLIYCPTLWAELSSSPETSLFEKHLSINTVHLPIDQRYTTDDMNFIIDSINS